MPVSNKIAVIRGRTVNVKGDGMYFIGIYYVIDRVSPEISK